MRELLIERERKLREFFGLAPDAELIARDVVDSFDVPAQVAAHLARFNIEWHVIPAERAVEIDTDEYRARLYSMIKRKLNPHEYQRTSHYRALMHGHHRHQGRIIGVETTPKPRYLPGNRQHYGTSYGFDDFADPLTPYFERAGLVTGMRYGHTYLELRKLVNVINDDWKGRELMPRGFRLTICPPVIFNLVGTIFHPEWSATESLELGFYSDAEGTASCYAVGSNAPGDFSYIRGIETDSDWTLLGFRTALVPA